MLQLSIIVPAYNAEQTIENALNSILRQRLEETELIIINDGSTDSTLDIVNRIADANRDVMPITVISHPNKGLSETRNIGIRAAQGRYWTTVDADDELVDGGIQAMLAAAERDGYPNMVYGNIEMVDFDGKLISYSYNRKTITDNLALDIISNYHIHYMTAWGKLFNRQFTVDNNLWYVKGLIKRADTELTWRMLPKIKSASFVDKTVYLYNRNAQSLTASFKGMSEIDGLFLLQESRIANIPLIASGAKLEDVMREQSIYFAYYIRQAINLYYLDNYPNKLSMLRRIRKGLKKISFDYAKYHPFGFSHLIAQLLKTGVILPHLAMLTVTAVPSLRKQLRT